jgi:hypothetical protein
VSFCVSSSGLDPAGTELT